MYQQQESLINIVLHDSLLWLGERELERQNKKERDEAEVLAQHREGEEKRRGIKEVRVSGPSVGKEKHLHTENIVFSDSLTKSIL